MSDGLVDWRDHSTAFTPSTSGWDDYTVWTESTLRGEDGQWHYFYTGTTRAEDGKIQRIGHAVGSDLETWERVNDAGCIGFATSSDLYGWTLQPPVFQGA